MSIFLWICIGFTVYNIYSIIDSSLSIKRSKKQIHRLEKWNAKLRLIQTLNRLSIPIDPEKYKDMQFRYEMERMLEDYGKL